MATYPTYTQDYGSTRRALNSTAIDVSGDGTLRATINHSATIYEFTVLHDFLTATEKNAIQTFYETNKALTFSFTYQIDSVAYTLMFNGEPEVRKRNATYWTVIMKATGTVT